MVRSMTSFAREEAVILQEQTTLGSVSCELRSVNHRYLEMNFRLPDVLRHLEVELRELLKGAVNRGKFDITMQYKIDAGDASRLQINDAFAQKIVTALNTLDGYVDSAAPINLLELMQWPGVVESEELNGEALSAAAKNAFSGAIKSIIANREREGAELKQFLQERLKAMEVYVGDVKDELPSVLHDYKEKLQNKLNAIAVDLDKDRLQQEVVYVAQKMDVAEELDRLMAHLGEVRYVLKQNKPIGRRLDFLMQELNRETNTLSSKSISSKVSQVAVELKVLIEQMREQIQNIE